MQRVLSLIYALITTNWISFFKFYSRNANHVLWVFPTFPSVLTFKYILTAGSLRDIALIKAFLKLKIPFRLILGKSIGGLRGKHIFFTTSEYYNYFEFSNHNFILHSIISQLELQNNYCYPSSKEVKFWENKKYMHQMFLQKNINHPKTWLSDFDKINLDSVKFPLLLKLLHTNASKGMVQIKNKEDFISIIQDHLKKGVSDFMIQELLPMSRDLRVIVIGDKIILHYWRINESKEWKPTSTSHGSNVDFKFIPEKWVENFIETLKKLELRTGAFDITWLNDDLNTAPFYLEVSPGYLPNPELPSLSKFSSYASYKKSIFNSNPYFKSKVDVIDNVNFTLVKYYLNL